MPFHAIVKTVSIAPLDIDRHSLQDDPKWKDAASEAFLRHAARAITRVGSF